jgi:hypothetical protein
MTAGSQVLLVNRIDSDLLAHGTPPLSGATRSAAALTMTAAGSRPLDLFQSTRAPV